MIKIALIAIIATACTCSVMGGNQLYGSYNTLLGSNKNLIGGNDNFLGGSNRNIIRGNGN
jgi:hypothetical protein